MMISIKHLIDTIEKEIKRKYYFYDLGINFGGSLIVVTIGSKRNPNKKVNESFSFHNNKYEDPDFIVWKVAEMVYALEKLIYGRRD